MYAQQEREREREREREDNYFRSCNKAGASGYEMYLAFSSSILELLFMISDSCVGTLNL